MRGCQSGAWLTVTHNGDASARKRAALPTEDAETLLIAREK